MYFPRSVLPFNFNPSQVNVLKYYYKNNPFLATPVLQEIYKIFGCTIPIIHIKYWFINKRNSEIFRRFVRIAPKKRDYPQVIPKLRIPSEHPVAPKVAGIKRPRESELPLSTPSIQYAGCEPVAKKQKIGSIGFLLN